MNKGDAVMIMSMASGGGDTGKTTVALTEEIEAFCMEKGTEIVGKIMYDNTITKSMISGVPVVAFAVEPKSKAAEEITQMWNRLSGFCNSRVYLA